MTQQNKHPLPSYSILLMRDDRAVSAFRLRAFWLKLFFLFVLLLVIGCAFGIYGSYRYSTRYARAAYERDTLNKELAEIKVRLQGYVNLASIPDGSSYLDAGKSYSTMIMPVQSAAGAQPDDAGGALIVGVAPLPVDLQSLLGQGGPGENPGAPEQLAVPGADDHMVKVDKLQGQPDGGANLKIAFDVSNQKPGPGVFISGNCYLSAVTRSGATVDLPVSRGLFSFKIGNYRRMQATIPMPQGLAFDDITAFKVVVRAGGHPEYWRIFPQ